ncbi:MAG: SPOR domain-containing protein [Bacteroidetes bacterium]|nr:SPOR domain-containing protein [Bacteroidota bacterium]
MKNSILLFLSLFLSLRAYTQVTVQTNLPPSIAPGTEALVEVKINKGVILNFSKYQIDVPAGVTVSEGDSRTGNFTFDENRAKIVWVSLPSEPEIIVTFKMTMPSSTGPGVFNHKFYYLGEDGKKEVEFEAVNVNFDASGAKSFASLGGKAATDPAEKGTAKTTATLTTSSGDPVTNNNSGGNNTNTEPVKTNTEPVKTNTEPVKTNAEPVKTNTEPVVNTTSKENTTAKENTSAKTNNTASSSSSGLVFKIQIGAYGENPSPSLFKGLSEKVTVVKEGGFYKALVGKFSTKEDAVSKINQLKGQGFQGFVVRYQDGVRVK